MNHSATLTSDPSGSTDQGQAPGLQQPSLSPQSASALPGQTLSPMALDIAADDTDREQGSLDTTLIGHQKRKPFYKRRGVASEAALSTASTSRSLAAKSKSARKARKSSFLSRFYHKVVPCVGPDLVKQDPPSPNIEKEKSTLALKDKEKSSLVQISTELAPSRNSEGDAVMPIVPLMAPPPITISVPPSPTDSEVIIPPPPSAHLLPEDETDGLTSGAVQPPGSTGDPIVRTLTRDSTDESDGTSFTDDEGDDHHAMDEQAEEERLIKNGGSGTPIGPVRTLVPRTEPS